jgi:hypothetical protein
LQEQKKIAKRIEIFIENKKQQSVQTLKFLVKKQNVEENPPENN